MGISEDTLTRRKQDTAEFADAINKGRAKAAEEVSNALYTKATVEKDLGAIIWYEKTRRGLTDKVQQEHSGGLTIKVIYAEPNGNTDPPKAP